MEKDDEPALIRRYDVVVFPSFVWTDAGGEELTRTVQPLDAEELLADLAYALEVLRDVEPASEPQDAVGETVGIELAFPGGGPAQSVTGLRAEIATAELVPPTTPDGAAAVLCTVRLRRKDGSDAGPAWIGRQTSPEGWTGRLVHGEESRLFFEGPLGTGWYVILTPDLSDPEHVRWTATGEYVPCTK